MLVIPFEMRTSLLLIADMYLLLAAKMIALKSLGKLSWRLNLLSNSDVRISIIDECARKGES